MRDSTDPTAQFSLFISYSRQDIDIARRVHAALAAHGLLAWFDQAQLQPGTPNWENAIRAALQQSRALILIASPNSRQSPYVGGELELARFYQCTIYPLWVLGDHWIQAVPLALSYTQHIDARGPNEPAAIQTLIATLQYLYPPTARPPQPPLHQAQLPAWRPASAAPPAPAPQHPAKPIGTLLATLKDHTGL